MGNKYEQSFRRMSIGNASKKEDIKTPKYFCKTCTKCVNSRCSVFDRHIEPDYNRCFNHSNYSPNIVPFKAPSNIEEIAKDNEGKIYA